jgi:hypothetical protein
MSSSRSYAAPVGSIEQLMRASRVVGQWRRSSRDSAAARGWFQMHWFNVNGCSSSAAAQSLLYACLVRFRHVDPLFEAQNDQSPKVRLKMMMNPFFVPSKKVLFQGGHGDLGGLSTTSGSSRPVGALERPLGGLWEH